jgi:hypothetical protein
VVIKTDNRPARCLDPLRCLRIASLQTRFHASQGSRWRRVDDVRGLGSGWADVLLQAQRWARIHALGFGVSLMIVVGTDPAGASRCDVVATPPFMRFSGSGACHGASAPSSVAGAPSGGHDGLLAGG